MIITGVDSSPDTLAALKSADSRIVASASQDPYGMAKQAGELAVGIMQGRAPPQPVVLLDTQLVAKARMATFKGWDAQH